MRILFLTPELPNRYGGGAFRMYCQIKYLNSMGVKIDLISYKSDIETDIYNFVNEVHVFDLKSSFWERIYNPYPLSKKFNDKLIEILNKNCYDIIHVHKFQMAGYLYNVDKIPIVIDLWACGLKGIYNDFIYEDDVFKKSRILFRMFKYYINDIKNYNFFQNYFVVSDEAKLYITNRYLNKNVWVIQNGIESLCERNVNNKGFNLIFVGDMSFAPNVDCVLYFYKNIYIKIKKYIKDIKFWVVGKNPVRQILDIAKLDKTVFATESVKDVNEYLANSDVFVAPLRSGSGVRTKILQAMGCGLPVITNLYASEGIDVKDGENILIYKTDEDFIQKLLFLYNNRKLVKFIGENARETIKKKYLWKDIAKNILGSYEQILNNNNNKRQ